MTAVKKMVTAAAVMLMLFLVPDVAEAQNNSFLLTTQQASWTQPGYLGEFRMEMWLSGTGIGVKPFPTADFFSFGGIPLRMSWSGNDIWIYKENQAQDSLCAYQPSLFPDGALIRVQYQSTGGSAGFGVLMCELQNAARTVTVSTTANLTTAPTPPAFAPVIFGQTNGGGTITFARVLTTLVPMNSSPPTPTSAVGDLVNFDFNGNVNNTAPIGNPARGGNITFGVGAAAYTTNPPGGAFAFPKTMNAPFWTSVLPCRGGAVCQLDGTASYTLSEVSGQLFYRWSPLQGPVEWKFQNERVGQPLLTTPPVFGKYRARLQVTDSDGSTGTSDLTFSSVAYDSKGVVVQANGLADKIYGPMVARGQNPWAYADKTAKDLITIAATRFATMSPPLWREWKTGTVDYRPAGISTTVTNTPGTTGTTIIVASTAGMDLTVPSILTAGTGIFISSLEYIRVCSWAGTTATVCPGGRGYGGTNAQNLAPGSAIAQAQITGTGTAFLTEVCPAGIGNSGTVYYNTGTVSATNGNNTLTGSGTTFTSAMNSRLIRVQGTSGGNPFVFTGFVTFVNATTITISEQAGGARVWPGDTASGLTYAILNNDRLPVLEWSHPTIPKGGASPLESSTIQFISGATVCESNTRMYASGIYEFMVPLVETGSQYTVSSGDWIGTSVFQTNYYDEVLGFYGEWLASGDESALDTARMLADYWAWNPQFSGGRTGNSPAPRQVSWSGVFASTVLDPAAPALALTKGVGHSYNWPVLRYFLSTYGPTAAVNCNDDLRELAYTYAFMSLGAITDPSASVTDWRTFVDSIYTRDNTCKGSSPPFANPIPYVNGVEQTGLTLTNGSAIVTGSGIGSTWPCKSVAAGTATFTNGSGVVTKASGTDFPSGGYYLEVLGVRANGPYTLSYTYNSGTQITIGAWPLASGTYSFNIIPTTPFEDALYFRNASVNPAVDSSLNESYSCTWNSASQVTLDRPWAGPNITGTGAAGRFLIVGNGTQPFMNGIKGTQQQFGTQSGATNAASFIPLVAGVAGWLSTDGYDASTKGSWYGAGFPQCTPQIPSLPNVGCSLGLYGGRTLNTESFLPLASDYARAPSGSKATMLNQYYGAVWGQPGYQTGGYYSDTINAWSGAGITFQDGRTFIGNALGYGFPRVIPAVLSGGPDPEQLVPVRVAADLGVSTSMRVTLVYPSGKQVSQTCAASTCAVNADKRMGSTALMMTEFLTGATVNRRTGLSSVTIN